MVGFRYAARVRPGTEMQLAVRTVDSMSYCCCYRLSRRVIWRDAGGMLV
jgi:hypothetical protein